MNLSCSFQFLIGFGYEFGSFHGSLLFGLTCVTLCIWVVLTVATFKHSEHGVSEILGNIIGS